MKRSALTALLTIALAGASFSFAPRDASTPKERFQSVLLGSFSKWDTDGDGQLSALELQRCVVDPLITGETAAVVVALRTKLLSSKDPKFVLTRELLKSDEGLIEELTSSFRKADSRIQKAADSPIFISDAPTLVGCHQGSLGDCYLIAATGAVISRDPSAITRMIQLDAGKPTYHVRYGDGSEIEVPILTDCELAGRGASMSNGLWLRILEKAWGYRYNQNAKRVDPTAEPQEVIGKGGSPRVALEALTGHRASQYRLGGSGKKPNISIENLRRSLTDAFDGDRLAVADTSKTKVPGINGRHAYTILGFDVEKDEITVWNPHVNRFKPKGTPGEENGYPTDKGQFSMPLAAFMNTFSGISIETDQTKNS